MAHYDSPYWDHEGRICTLHLAWLKDGTCQQCIQEGEAMEVCDTVEEMAASMDELDREIAVMHAHTSTIDEEIAAMISRGVAKPAFDGSFTAEQVGFMLMQSQPDFEARLREQGYDCQCCGHRGTCAVACESSPGGYDHDTRGSEGCPLPPREPIVPDGVLLDDFNHYPDCYGMLYDAQSPACGKCLEELNCKGQMEFQPSAAWGQTLEVEK